MEDDLGQIYKYGIMIHDGMPISLDKIARNEPFAGGPYKADISAYSCRECEMNYRIG